jgi:hypothetical protein
LQEINKYNMKTGYLLIADILGFSNIIRNVPNKELNERMSDWTNLIKELGKEFGFTDYQLLSDTLFLSVEGSDNETFEKLIHYCQKLLSGGLEKFLPIKGALTYGEYEWGDFIYGKAIITGHEIESSQNWIGVTLQNGIPNTKSHWSPSKIICYPPPMKGGKIKLYPVIAWAVPDYDTLIKQTIGKGLTIEGEQLNWSWAEKIRNTIEFKIYLDILKKENKTGEQFSYMMPIQAISTIFDKTT